MRTVHILRAGPIRRAWCGAFVPADALVLLGLDHVALGDPDLPPCPECLRPAREALEAAGRRVVRERRGEVRA